MRLPINFFGACVFMLIGALLVSPVRSANNSASPQSDWVSSAFPSVMAADAAATAAGKSLIIDQPWTLSDDTTLSAREVVFRELVTLGGHVLHVKGFAQFAPYQNFLPGEVANLKLDKPPLTITAETFGAKADGKTDDAPAINAALKLLAADHGGHVALRPNRDYLSKTQITLDLTHCAIAPYYDCKPEVSGYGASLRTQGNLWAFQVKGTATLAGAVLNGLYVFQLNNAAAQGGVQILGSPHAIVNDLNVVCGGSISNPGYVGFDVANLAPSNGNTGSFWTTLRGYKMRTLGVGSCDVGVKLHGNQNEFVMEGGSISGAGKAILITNDPGQTLLSNDVDISTVAFEKDGIAVAVEGVSGVRGPSGLIVRDSGIDSKVPVFFSYTAPGGAMKEPAVIPTIDNNRNGTTGKDIHNPGNMKINVRELQYSPTAPVDVRWNFNKVKDRP